MNFRALERGFGQKPLKLHSLWPPVYSELNKTKVQESYTQSFCLNETEITSLLADFHVLQHDVFDGICRIEPTTRRTAGWWAATC